MLPLILYTDDTSGNKSKQWNKFDSWCVKIAGIPNDDNMSLENIHHLCSSNKVECNCVYSLWTVCMDTSICASTFYSGRLHSDDTTNCGRTKCTWKRRCRCIWCISSDTCIGCCSSLMCPLWQPKSIRSHQHPWAWISTLLQDLCGIYVFSSVCKEHSHLVVLRCRLTEMMTLPLWGSHGQSVVHSNKWRWYLLNALQKKRQLWQHSMELRISQMLC